MTNVYTIYTVLDRTSNIQVPFGQLPRITNNSFELSIGSEPNTMIGVIAGCSELVHITCSIRVDSHCSKAVIGFL